MARLVSRTKVSFTAKPIHSLRVESIADCLPQIQLPVRCARSNRAAFQKPRRNAALLTMIAVTEATQKAMSIRRARRTLTRTKSSNWLDQAGSGLHRGGMIRVWFPQFGSFDRLLSGPGC